MSKSPSGLVKLLVEFLLCDPLFYGPNITEETKIIQSPTTTWNHNTLGSAPVTNLSLTFTGPLDSPKLENTSRSIWVQYQGTLLAGEMVILNTKDFSAIKGPTSCISAIKHSGDALWMALDPGVNALALTSGTVGGSVRITYYPPYF